MRRPATPIATTIVALQLLAGSTLAQTDWPRFRGGDGSGVSADDSLPLRWDRRTGIAWSARIPGEGNSSPIVKGARVFITSAEEGGRRRSVLCLDRATGAILWTRTIEDDAPEISSSATGHAAATPAADDRRVVAFFGNAGAVAYDLEGRLLWRERLGRFETELGLASSPVFEGDRVILLCDHDGDRFKTFDSFLVALSLADGKQVWKRERPDVFRSWSTPILVPAPAGPELVVPGQGEVRGYRPATGELLWRARGLRDWVAPSPVFGEGVIVASSGPDGDVLAIRPGGSGDVTSSRVAWKIEKEGPYVTSPVIYRGRLYLIQEKGRLSCFRAGTGERLFEEQLKAKFTASPFAGAGRVYITGEDGSTEVLEAADRFRSLARNELEEYTAASAAVAGGRLFIRTERQLFCIAGAEGSSPAAAPRSSLERAVDYLAAETPRWPRENKCFSCHNNGDAARALIAARAASLRVPDSSLTATTEWLLEPDRWAEKPSPETERHPQLAPIQFAAALLAATVSNVAPGRAALERAAEVVVRSQRPDGSWGGESEGGVGSPTAYSPHLATHFGRKLLLAVGGPRNREAAGRAGSWLLGTAPRNVHQAAVLLLGAEKEPRFPGEPRLSECLALLKSGRASDGGWGPYANSPPEVFDTALALLAIARVKAELSTPDRIPIEAWIRGGRAYLEKTQEAGGHWVETTRPPGAESYAQRISTTAWAVMALLATR